MAILPSILLIDDSPVNRYALKATLDHAGVELVRAGSGAKALRLVLQRDFAVIPLSADECTKLLGAPRLN